MIQLRDRAPVLNPPAKPRPKKFTLIRRFWRRSRRYLLMAVMAFTLSFGLVAVPVVKAEADLLSAATIAEINGAMRMPLTQVAVNAIKLHPVGFALGTAASLALLAYATKDQWLPYVTGAFGEGESNTEPTPLATQQRHVVDTAVLEPDGVTVTAKYSNTTPFSQDWYAHFGVVAHCKKDAPDGSFQQGYKYSGGNWSIGGNNATNWTYTRNFVPCPLDWRVTGFIVAGGQGTQIGTWTPNLNTSDPNPAQMNALESQFSYATKNIIKWGDMGGAAGFDPRGGETTYVTSAECIDSTGALSTVTATSTGTDQMMKLPACPAGSHGTGKMWIDGYAPGTTVPERLYDVDPMNDPDHPLCSPTRPGSGCTLGVSIDGKPCIVGEVQCENWTEIRRDDATGARVSCNYGPYLVGVDKCNILERAYQIGGAPATEENIDGNPSTSNWNQPNGDPWKPQPQPEPGTGTNTSTLPMTGTNPSSNPGEDGQNCFAQGWSWNPVSWVMVPVQCSLQWAFVPPKLKVETALQSIQPRLEARGITPFVTPFMGSLSTLGGSGCSGPAIDLSVVKLPVFYPFSACAEPMSHIASGVSSFFALSLVVQGGMSCIRGVAAAFGFNWGLGSSKTEDGS